MFVGIDPGFKGAIAFLSPNKELVIHDMPVWAAAKGKTVLNLIELAKILTPSHQGPRYAVLEKVFSRPNEGVSSAFRFGQGYGSIQMALAGHGYRVFDPTPTVWKKAMGLSQDKGVSRSVATQHFPQYAELFSRVKDDGRAEAALMAVYCYHQAQKSP